MPTLTNETKLNTGGWTYILKILMLASVILQCKKFAKRLMWMLALLIYHSRDDEPLGNSKAKKFTYLWGWGA